MTNRGHDALRAFNKNRRQFLTLGGVSVVSFILGKVLGPRINIFSRDYAISEKEFKNFRVVETNKEMKLYDRRGDEIMIVEKEGFTQ